MHHIEYNLKQLIRKLSAQNGRDYELQQVGKACGLSRFTISSIANNASVRIELRTLERLMNFFAAEGMVITVADLFNVTLAPATLTATGEGAPGEAKG